MKKIIYFVIILGLVSAIVDFFDKKALKESSNIETSINEQLIDVDVIQELSIDITSFDDLYNRADEIRNDSFNLIGTEKIDFITTRVSEDIPLNVDNEIILDALDYVITEYENRRFNKNAPVNLYITRFLDKQLDQYPEFEEADSMIFDMFQICKEILRMTSDNLVEASVTISNNEDQIDEILESVKSILE